MYIHMCILSTHTPISNKHFFIYIYIYYIYICIIYANTLQLYIYEREGPVLGRLAGAPPH